MRRYLALAVMLLAALPCATQVTDLPTLSDAREVTTVFEDGAWHHRFGNRRDNHGDGQVGYVFDGDKPRLVLMKRMGTPPPGGAFWAKDEGESIYEGWTGNQQQPPIKGLPGIPPMSHINIDTHHWVQNPYTGVVTWLHGMKPGTRPKGAGGLIFALGRATSSVFTAERQVYTRFPNEPFLQVHPDVPWEQPVHYVRYNEYWGGVAEGSIFYDVFHDVIAGFYVAKRREDPDAFGNRHRSRIGRYFCELEDFDTNPKPVRSPAPGPASYIWDPIRDGANGEYGSTNETAIWGTNNSILQPSVSMDPLTGYYHLFSKQTKPNTRQGVENRSEAIGHWWSPNQGDDWYADAGNPIITLDDLGWARVSANQLNSPNCYWSKRLNKGFIFFWGNPEGRQNKLGTRLWCVEFSL